MAILFLRAILSWFPRLPEWARPVAHFCFVLTEPVVRLARPLIPPIRIGAMALDVSFILIFILLGLLRTALGCNPFLIF